MIRIANEHLRDPEMIEWGSRGLGIRASEFRWKEGTVHVELPDEGILVPCSGPAAQRCDGEMEAMLLAAGLHTFIHPCPSPSINQPHDLAKVTYTP